MISADLSCTLISRSAAALPQEPVEQSLQPTGTSRFKSSPFRGRSWRAHDWSSTKFWPSLILRLLVDHFLIHQRWMLLKIYCLGGWKPQVVLKTLCVSVPSLLVKLRCINQLVTEACWVLCHRLKILSLLNCLPLQLFSFSLVFESLIKLVATSFILLDLIFGIF